MEDLCCMPHYLTILPVRLVAYAMAMTLAGCASSGAKLTSPSRHRAPVERNDSSTAIGLVGLLAEKPWVGPPRAPGMTGAIVGYVVTHPALPNDLFVVGRDGQSMPVLAFKLTFVIAKEEGRQGPEEIRGHGNLRIFYKPDGFNDTVLHYSGAFENTQEIELDHIEFYADPDSGSDRLYRHVRETAIATHAFELGGRPWRTPSSRTGSDLLVGQYSDSFVGEVYVSSGTLQTQSPEETLVGLVGAPNRKVRY